MSSAKKKLCPACGERFCSFYSFRCRSCASKFACNFKPTEEVQKNKQHRVTEWTFKDGCPYANGLMLPGAAPGDPGFRMPCAGGF